MGLLIPCSQELVGSNPTPRALVVDSYEHFINLKKQDKIDNLQDPVQPPSKQTAPLDARKEEVRKFSVMICKYQKSYIKNSLYKLLESSIENAEIICNYIIAEQNEINIKESTKEGKIKVLLDLVKFLNYKELNKISKEDIFSYLNRYRKPEESDPTHSWIGTWNNRHLILLKFFRWLYDPDNPDIKNRKSPGCMNGIKRLSRKEISRYKPSYLWTSRECEIFLKYCPSKRDRAFLSMATDTSARPHELLSLKIEDIKFRSTNDGSKQYAEITINGKTGQRTVPLINSLPYVKEWILDHPSSDNHKDWLFISEGKTSFGKKITRDGLLKHFQDYYKKRYYPNLLLKEIPEVDKAYIKNLLTKPWNLYVHRHGSLTEKSSVLTEHMLRNHAGWSISSLMPRVYIHHLGNASSKQLLQSSGIIEKDQDQKTYRKRIRFCPNCNEPNKEENKVCFRCRIVLTVESYNEARNEDKNKIKELENDMSSLKEGMKTIFLLIQNNTVFANAKPEVLGELIKSRSKV